MGYIGIKEALEERGLSFSLSNLKMVSDSGCTVYVIVLFPHDGGKATEVFTTKNVVDRIKAKRWVDMKDAYICIGNENHYVKRLIVDTNKVAWCCELG